MKRISAFLLGAIVVLLLGATSEVRITDLAYSTNEIERCIAIVADVNDLGTDPTDPTFQTGVGTLEDDTKTYLKFDDTSVPAGLCTTGGSAQSHADTVCAKEDPDLVSNYVGVGLDKVTFACVDPAAFTTEVLRGVIDCP